MDVLTRHDLKHLREYEVSLSDKMKALNRTHVAEGLCRRIRKHDRLNLFLLTDEAANYAEQLYPYIGTTRSKVLELDDGHWMLTLSYPNGRRLFTLDIYQEET